MKKTTRRTHRTEETSGNWRPTLSPEDEPVAKRRGFAVKLPDGTCAMWDVDHGGVVAVWNVGERPAGWQGRVPSAIPLDIGGDVRLNSNAGQVDAGRSLRARDAAHKRYA